VSKVVNLPSQTNTGARSQANFPLDITNFDSLMLLYPFLQIIQTKGTAAPITVLALRAVRKFLSYGFLAPESPRFALAMQSLSTAITHCQFDIIDPPQEEVVLLMILHLMEDMLSGPGGDILSDDSICDLMGRGLTICSRKRFSEVLRQTAEASMVRMCQIIFEDLKHLEVEAGEESDALDKQTNKDMDTVKMDPVSNGTDLPEQAQTQAPSEPQAAPVSEARPSTSSEPVSSSGDTPASGEAGRSSTSSASEGSESLDLRPYSLPSIRELFRALVNFLDPHDRVHPDQMRVMALRIIHVALEVAGPSIARHPALAIIAEDKLCCYLFQLVKSDNMAILQEALVVTSTLLSTCRGVLKLQQELYLSYLVACLHPSVDIPREPGIDPSLYAGIPQAPKLSKPPPSQPNGGRATPVPARLSLEGGTRKPDARQAMVENIGVLARMPTFMVELFINYDCDQDRGDLCEDMIGLLARNALPDSATWSTTSVPPLCLDALLRFIQFIAERLSNAPVTEGYPSPEKLREQRRNKKLVIKGTSKFNTSPKAGLAFLQENGVIRDISDPEAVAGFLKQTSRVNKKMLGEFLSKKGNEPVLNAFMDSFDFADKRIDEALRMLLESFRLPGESALIERIVKSFSERYIENAKPETVVNSDAAYVLTYAIIMLNTDQHNPNMKQARMEPKDFARNLRGVNDNGDFTPEFLAQIYDAIKSNEIILPDEHDNKHAFDYAWKELLLKTESAGPLVICDTNIYDADMFATTWNPIISCLSFVFMSATDDTVYGRVIAGFDECARIASKYGNTEALDEIIFRLSHMSTLATEAHSNTSLNTEVQVKEDSVMVSELAVKFGSNFRAQLATLVLFHVIRKSEDVIQSGWKHVRILN
jgi:brefeldin A-resistance guanine nucleotide exchange factor 1